MEIMTDPKVKPWAGARPLLSHLILLLDTSPEPTRWQSGPVWRWEDDPLKIYISVPSPPWNSILHY